MRSQPKYTRNHRIICFSTVEYPRPVWSWSGDAGKVDISLNETNNWMYDINTPKKPYKAAGLDPTEWYKSSQRNSSKLLTNVTHYLVLNMGIADLNRENDSWTESSITTKRLPTMQKISRFQWKQAQWDGVSEMVVQDVDPLLICLNCKCIPDDLWLDKPEALNVAQY